MYRRFKNKIKGKSPKTSQPGTPTEVAPGSPGPQPEPTIDPKDDGGDGGSQIPPDKRSEDQGLIAPGASTSGAIVGATERGYDPMDADAGDAGGRGSKPVEASRVGESARSDSALGGDAIRVNVPREAAAGFGPLKAVLEIIPALYANPKETAAVGDKIEGLLSRIEMLEARFTTLPGDVAEQRRRRELTRKFGVIEAQLRSLTEEPGLRGLGEHAQGNDEVYGLLEDLREIGFDYQVTQQTAIYDQRCKLITQAEASVLNGFRYAQGAEYRHGDRKGCLKGTRGAVLDEIELWAREYHKPPVYWLNGLAGTGKSTIAQTIAERVFADGQLGASFFCSRDFDDRSNLKCIFPTLAVQLARNYAEFRSIFVPLAQSDPGIAHESLSNQMEKLIVQPLKESNISTVMVIDALDECKDEEPASAILTVLGQFISQIPRVKFFITGRPEPRIQEGFRLHLPAKTTDIFVLHDVEPSLINNDIRVFFKQRFSELSRHRQGLDGWPTTEQLDLLCDRAAGLFVYAAATVKFIDHKSNHPRGQLDRLLQSPGNSAREARTEFKENSTLDLLYMSILQEAFGKDDPEDDPKSRSFIGAVILTAYPLSPSTIATLLGFDATDVFLRLSSIHSLLLLQDINQPVRPFHKSFPDFIIDQTRCTDQRFYVSPLDHHLELLIGCFELMSQRLEKNMCKLPDGVINSEVDDLGKRVEQYIDSALQYACKSWHKHLILELMVPTPTITSILHHFLEKKFVFWLEVLSVLGAAREAADALGVAARWLKASPTLDLVNDCFRFVTRFFEVISKSAPHIYHSALPLSSKMLIVHELYESFAHPLARIIHGLPTPWDQSIITKKIDRALTATWSPCSRYVAVSSESGVVDILDAMTLEQINVLNTPLSSKISHLLFSADGHWLTCYSNQQRRLITLDIQTGVLVCDIPSGGETHGSGFSPLLVATACRTLIGLLRYGETITVNTYNLLSGTHLYSHFFEQNPFMLWEHDGHIQYLTLDSGLITIWEIGFSEENPPTEVRSLPAPSNFKTSEEFHFLPTLSWLAFVFENTICIWDIQHSKLLLNSVHALKPQFMTFSSDYHLFTYETRGPEIYLWMNTPTGYILHRKIISSIGGLNWPCFSPNGQWIITSYNSICQLWHTTNPATSSSSIPTQPLQYSKEDLTLRFSPEGSLAVTVRGGEKTVVVLDLMSGDTLLTIDTDMKIYGLGVARNTIVVVGKGKVITWSSSPKDHTPNSRVNISNSVQTTLFEYSMSDHSSFDHPLFGQELSHYLLPDHPTSEYPLEFSLSEVSISPDLRYMAAIVYDVDRSGLKWLCLYDTATGERLTHIPVDSSSKLFFTPDGCEIWYGSIEKFQGWSIVEDSGSGVISLEHLQSHRPKVFPWEPSHGQMITDDGWALSSGGKRLLWLPHYWWSDFNSKSNRIWSGRFLAFLQPKLPEVIILELPEE